jgi:RNA polymerase sigma factor (sigma-70 family)
MTNQFAESMHQDASELIQACITGNQMAWNELVERYGKLVYSIPFHYGLSAEDADEVFQNVFTIVFRQLGQLRSHKAFVGWLITITRRETVLVARKLHSQSELGDDIEDHQPPPTEVVQRWERLHYIREALRRLGSPCRELLTILFIEEPAPSYDEIAKRLKMPVGSIGPNRGRCLKKLEAILLELKVDL